MSASAWRRWSPRHRHALPRPRSPVPSSGPSDRRARDVPGRGGGSSDCWCRSHSSHDWSRRNGRNPVACRALSICGTRLFAHVRYAERYLGQCMSVTRRSRQQSSTAGHCVRPRRADRASGMMARKERRDRSCIWQSTPWVIFWPCTSPRQTGRPGKVGPLAQAIQQATDGSVQLFWADQGYTGAKAENAAREQDTTLEIVRLPHAKCITPSRFFDPVSRCSYVILRNDQPSERC